jgi:hypothetical protein
MKRALVFVALTVAAIGMATGPASAAPLEKFSINSKQALLPGIGVPVLGKIKCPAGQIRAVNVLLTSPDDAGSYYTVFECTGQTQTWEVDVDGYFLAGRANACATTDVLTLNVKPRTCKNVKLVPLY